VNLELGELDKLKLKAVILCNKDIHLTQPVGFIVADLKTIDFVG